MKNKSNLKRIFSVMLSLTMISTLIPCLPISAETIEEKYPYTLFAGSDKEGAITLNANNVGINGNVATNGSIESTATNFNVNGTKTEYAGEEVLFFFKKLDYAYFNGNNVDTYTDDYTLEEMNININTPLNVGGEIELTGNINLSTGIKAVEDVNLNGEVKNTNNSVICSETGDIIINTTNVNLNGLVYAPNGCVEITAQNLNMNNIIVIADTIKIECPSINTNYSNSMAEFIGTESEVELEILSFAQYDKETNNISIEWNSTIPKGNFDIQISDNNVDYTTVGTVTNSASFDFNITEDFNKKYFRITETTYYGEIKSSVPFVAVKTDDGYEIQLLDTEEDGLPDIFEEIYGTNINKDDTDEDGLTDYQEIYLTNTNPTIYDSVTSNLSDANADSDEDGISNIEEINLGTNPILSDTDDDEISDYDEIHIYYTDPLKPDTDDDTITDGDELKLNLDPTNPETFGIPDAEYKILQTISADSETFVDINTEENPYKLSIDIIASGYAPNSMDASISGYTNSLTDNTAIVGNIVSLEYINNDFEDVTLNFEMDSEYLNNIGTTVTENLNLEGINRLHVFRYDKEHNFLYPVKTTINNNTLTVNTSELGDYCIVDLDTWINLLGIELTATENYNAAPTNAEIEIYNEETITPEITDEIIVVDETVPENYEEIVEENIEEAIAQIAEETPSVATFSLEDTSPILSAKHKIDLVYVIDTSGSMGSILNKAKSSMSNLVNSLNSAGIDVNVAVVSYDDYLNIGNNTTKTYYTSASSPWANTPEDASYLINQVYLTNGGHETPLDGLGMAQKLNFHSNATKFMVLITDEPYKYSYNRYGINSIQKMADMLKEDDIYTSVVCYDSDSSGYAPLYTTTNGININLSSDWVTYLEEYIKTYIRDLKTFTAFVPNSLTTISLNESPVYGAEVNSDNDSLWDYEEIDWTYIDQSSSELVLPTLVEYTMNITGTNPFETLPIAVQNVEKFNSVVVLPLLSNPTKSDSDDDGLNDYNDAIPFEVFDNRFMVINDFDYIPEPEYVTRHYEQGEKCYNICKTKSGESFYSPSNTLIGFTQITAMFLTSFGYWTPAQNAFELFDVPNINYTTSPNFSKYLEHYLWGSGKTLTIEEDDAWQIIYTQAKNYDHYVYNINQMMRVAEQIVNNEKVKYIATTPESIFITACYNNDKDNHSCDYHSQHKDYDNGTACDWGYAVGESLGGMVSEVYCKNEKYFMNLKYYIIDTYEFPIHWNTNDSNDVINSIMHLYHELGAAKEYKIIGTINETISWEKGDFFCQNFCDIKITGNYNDVVIDLESSGFSEIKKSVENLY